MPGLIVAAGYSRINIYFQSDAGILKNSHLLLR